jgi:hypothetical protein
MRLSALRHAASTPFPRLAPNGFTASGISTAKYAPHPPNKLAIYFFIQDCGFGVGAGAVLCCRFVGAKGLLAGATFSVLLATPPCKGA